MEATNIFAVGNVLDPHITIQGQCRKCQGTGQGEHIVRCGQCNRSYYPARPGNTDKADIEAAYQTDFTPCGHAWGSWYEHSFCYECEGTGEVTDLVRLSDLIAALGPALERVNISKEQPDA